MTDLNNPSMVESTIFTYEDQDKISINVYKWMPSENLKAIVQISHGMLEHAKRYERLTTTLCKSGFGCYANDHQGHGLTAGDLTEATLKGHAGVLGPNGWKSVANSMHELTKLIKKEHPNKPLFLLGHSWGSFLAQHLIQEWGSEYNGVILSGSNGSINKAKLKLGRKIGLTQAKKLGLTVPSEKMNNLVFKSLNNPWKKEPGATGYEWLSRDKEEVKKYIEDPWCGFIAPAPFFVELFNLFEKIWDVKNEKNIPLDLPILFISGSQCSVSNQLKTLTPLIERYKSYGMKDSTFKVFTGARHEIFNEINREEVFAYLIDWLNKHV